MKKSTRQSGVRPLFQKAHRFLPLAFKETKDIRSWNMVNALFSYFTLKRKTQTLEHRTWIEIPLSGFQSRYKDTDNKKIFLSLFNSKPSNGKTMSETGWGRACIYRCHLCCQAEGSRGEGKFVHWRHQSQSQKFLFLKHLNLLGECKNW